MATLLYTSGTTGEPKGVMLTHNNVASNARACGMVFAITDADNTVSFLPLSHILQRMVDYLFFWVGCRIAYPRSIHTIVDDMQVIRPTIVVSVPRIYEKIYNGVMEARGTQEGDHRLGRGRGRPRGRAAAGRAGSRAGSSRSDTGSPTVSSSPG